METMKSVPVLSLSGLVCSSRQAARLNLFCFPYAGGGASVFRAWPGRLPDWMTVCAVQPPGRESRIKEPAIADVYELVDALLPSILAHTDLPFAFMGYSTGALVAFEMTRRLRREGMALPVLLCVAAARAPHIPEPRPLHHLPKDALIEGLRRFSGTPEEILQSRELMDLYLPILRADLAIEELYEPVEEAPLDIDVAAFYGSDDEESPRSVVEPWRQYTARNFELIEVAGGHFFIKTARDCFLSALTGVLERVLSNGLKRAGGEI